MLFAVWLQASCSTSLNIHFLVSKGRANDRATERIGRRAQYKACHVNNTRNTHSIRRNCYCLHATYTISCGIYNSLCSRRIGVQAQVCLANYFQTIDHEGFIHPSVRLSVHPSIHPPTLASIRPFCSVHISMIPPICQTLSKGQKQRGIRYSPRLQRQARRQLYTSMCRVAEKRRMSKSSEA